MIQNTVHVETSIECLRVFGSAMLSRGGHDAAAAAAGVPVRVPVPLAITVARGVSGRGGAEAG